MSEKPTFSDEQLTAYLDGETDHIPADEISRALDRDAALRARLDRLSVETDDIADAFGRLLESAPPAPEVSLPEAAADQSSRWPSLHAIAAVAVLCLTVGWGAGYVTPRSDLTSWHDFVAAYQALYVNSTLAQVEQEDDAAASQLEHVAGAIGKPIDLSTLKQIEGLDYKRAQILGFEGQPLAQLTFLSEVGAPVALCIIRKQGEGDAEVELAELHGMSAASWSRDGYDYLLIGGSDAALIAATAGKLTNRL